MLTMPGIRVNQRTPASIEPANETVNMYSNHRISAADFRDSLTLHSVRQEIEHFVAVQIPRDTAQRCLPACKPSSFGTYVA